MLDGAGQGVFLSGDSGQVVQRFEVKLDWRRAPARKRDSTMTRPGLNGDLAEALKIPPESAPIARHELVQIFDLGVPRADLPNFAANRNAHSYGLSLSDEPREVRTDHVVVALLLFHRELGVIYQCRRINIDVVDTGGDRFNDEIANGLQLWLLAVRIGELRGVDLIVVALEEQWALEILANGSGEHAARVLAWALEGVSDLAAGELEDHRRCVGPFRDAKGRAGDVVGQTADIDRGDREAADLTAGSRVIESLDGCSPDPESGGCAADQSARDLHGSRVLVEDGVVHQLVGGGTAQCVLVPYAQ